MESVRKILVGETLRVGERSLIPLMAAHLYTARGGCIGQGNPYAIVVLDEEHLYIYSFVQVHTLHALLQEVPELGIRIWEELQRRNVQQQPPSELRE